MQWSGNKHLEYLVGAKVELWAMCRRGKEGRNHKKLTGGHLAPLVTKTRGFYKDRIGSPPESKHPFPPRGESAAALPLDHLVSDRVRRG